MAKPIIPDEPVYWFKGKRQSLAFSNGVEAFRAFLEQAENDPERGTTRLDDQEFAETCSARIAASAVDESISFDVAYRKHLGFRVASEPVAGAQCGLGERVGD